MKKSVLVMAFVIAAMSAAAFPAAAKGPGDYNIAPPTQDVVRAVPEPATWAMMIVGFGLIGRALRRKRAAGRKPELG
jgi:NADH/NAD ratio-sensing transcriptional regulator Rex